MRFEMYRAHLISSLLLVASLVSPVAPIAVRRGGGYYRRRSASAATAAARGSFDTGLPAARGDSFLKPHSSSSEARRWSGSLQPADASILRKLWSNMWGRAAAHSVRTTAGADSVRARMGDANASAAAARLAYDPDDPDPMVAEEEDAAESLTATVPLTTLRAIVAAGARRSTGAARRRETAAEARRRSRRTSRRGAERPFTVGAAQVPPPRLPSELSIRMLYAGIISAVLILLSGAALAARAARWYCDARCLDSQHRRPLRPAVRACGAELGVAGLLGLIGYVFVRSGAFDLLAVRLLGEQPGTQVVALFYHVHELVVISAAVYVALIVFVISSARVLMRKWRSFEVSRHADVLHYFDEELRADARDGFLAPCCRPCRRGGVARGKERMAFMALREATLQLIVSPTEQLGRRSERAYGFDFAQYLGHSLGAVVGSVALVTVWMWCLVEVLLTLVLCLPGPDAVASGWVPLVVVAWGYVLLAALVALDAALHRTFWSTTMRAVHSYKAVEDAWMEEGGREDARASMRRRRGGGKGGKEKDDDGLSERGNRRFRKMYEEWRRADADGMYEPEADGASTRRCCGVSVGRTQARVARMMREVVVVLRTVLLLGATYVAALGLVASLLLRRRGRRAGWTAAIAIAAGLVPIFATLARLPPMLEKLILISKTSRVGLDRTVISEVSREQRARSAVGALRVYDWLFSLVTAEHAKPVSWNDLLDTMMANSRQAPMLIDDATEATLRGLFTRIDVGYGDGRGEIQQGDVWRYLQNFFQDLEKPSTGVDVGFGEAESPSASPRSFSFRNFCAAYVAWAMTSPEPEEAERSSQRVFMALIGSDAPKIEYKDASFKPSLTLTVDRFVQGVRELTGKQPHELRYDDALKLFEEVEERAMYVSNPHLNFLQFRRLLHMYSPQYSQLDLFSLEDVEVEDARSREREGRD